MTSRAGALTVSVVSTDTVRRVSCGNVSEGQQERVRLIIILQDIGEKVQSVTAKKELLKV